MNLFDLEINKPGELALAKHEVAKAVAKVEKDMSGADSKAKELAALQMTYDALDMLIGFPGPVDMLFKNIVIPHIPNMIKWAVDKFNEMGWPDDNA